MTGTATAGAEAIWGVIVDAAAAESSLWAQCALPAATRRHDAVFSCLVPDPRFALGLETIYEGYLAHYGRPRLFDPPDTDTALLLGDYLYAHGLVRVAATGSVAAVNDLAELISLCAQARAEGRPGDGEAWAATAALLGRGALADARNALRDHGDPGPLGRQAAAAAGPEPVAVALDRHVALCEDASRAVR
jgi:hypothetical protein